MSFMNVNGEKKRSTVIVTKNTGSPGGQPRVSPQDSHRGGRASPSKGTVLAK